MLEDTARYAGLHLASADGFGLLPSAFLPFGPKKTPICCVGPFMLFMLFILFWPTQTIKKLSKIVKKFQHLKYLKKSHYLQNVWGKNA